MANNLIGEITPNVYVSSITLEGGGSFISSIADPHIDHDREPDFEIDPVSGKRKITKRVGSFAEARLGQPRLTITLDLVLKEILDNSLIGSWFGQQDFLKYLKLKVFQFSNKNIFDSIKNDFSNIANIDNKVRTLLGKPSSPKRFFEEKTVIEEQKVIENNVQVKELIISQNIKNDKVDVLKHFNEFDANGNRVFDIPIQLTFNLPTLYPEFLSYILFSYLDIEELAQDLGFRNALPNLFVPIGKVVAEEVIVNSTLKTNTFAFFNENGELWTGAIEELNGEFFGKINNSTIKLQQTEVFNSKLRDFRITNNLEELKLNFSFTENIFNKIKLKRLSTLSSQASFDNSFISDILLSRDAEGNCRFGFFVDVRKILQNFSILGGLFSKITELQVFNDAVIYSLKVMRRRVSGSPEAGSKANIKFSFEKNQKDEVVVFSGEKTFKTFSKHESLSGIIKEIPTLTFINYNYLRFFTGIDREMKDITDGYYVYDVYLEISDPSYKFINEKIKELTEAKNDLFGFYTKASSFGSKSKQVLFSDPHLDFEGEKNTFSPIKTGNYDPFLNRFTNTFIKEMYEVYGDNETSPWRKAIKTYLSNMALFSDLAETDKKSFEEVLITLTHPATGNPAGIYKLLSLLETLILNLNSLIKNNITESSVRTSNTPLSKVFTKNFDVKVIKVCKKNTVPFNSNISINTGLDYFDVDDKFFDGLKTINGLDYIDRVDRETNKYFNNDKNLDISLKVRNDVYTENDLLERSGLTFLSPAKLKFASRFEIKRIGNSPTPNLSSEELAKVSVATKIAKANQITTFDTSINNKEQQSLNIQTTLNNVGGLLQNLGVSVNVGKQNVNTGLINNKKDVIDVREPSQDDKLVLEVGKCSITTLPKTSLPLVGKLLDDTKLIPSSTNTKNTFVISNEKKAIPLSKFDVRTDNHVLKTLLNDTTNIHSEVFFQGEKHSTTLNQAVSSLPNQVKSLFLGHTNAGAVRNAPELIDTTSFEIDYKLLNTILVLIGFLQDEQGFPIVNSPVWTPLTPARFNLGIGKSLLCKMRPYENSLVGIERSKDFDLPIFDEYFIITPTSPIIVKLNPLDLGTRPQENTNDITQNVLAQQGSLQESETSLQGKVPSVDIGQSSLSSSQPPTRRPDNNNTSLTDVRTPRTSGLDQGIATRSTSNKNAQQGSNSVSIDNQYLQTTNIKIK